MKYYDQDPDPKNVLVIAFFVALAGALVLGHNIIKVVARFYKWLVTKL